MQSVILVGNSSACHEYINKYIQTNQIKSYSVLWLEEKVKIENVREIKKSLTIKTYGDQKRLVILSSNITLEAQNALLKTLEEVPQNTEIIIYGSSKEILLPTIQSRSFVVDLNSKKEMNIGEDVKNLLEEYLANNRKLYSALFLSSLVSKSKNLEDFILCLREELIGKISQNQLDQAKRITLLMDDLIKYYPLTVSNNVNQKMVLDKVLLT